MALLDEVETQVVRTQRPDPSFHNLSERMRDLRHQVTEAEPETRHREALRSVQRAVAKFSDRDEAPVGPPNPRDTLESAIHQIRSRHFPAPAAAPAPQPVREVPRAVEMPRFDELAEAVGGISGRLERLEGELRSHARGQTTNVKEIADQVGQLSQVVELLAGAVGETGQVKRLESQIAGLAKLIGKEPQIDPVALTRRLDDVSHTVAKLAELQKAYADRSDTSGLTKRLDDVTATVGRLADLQVRLVERTDNTSLNKRLDDVTATVGKLADLQVQLVDKTDTAGLNRRLDDVTATVGKLANLQVQLVDKTDTSGLTRRLDDVTATVGRLADLQVQVASRVENPQAGLKDAMQAIEDGVRAIYDRVDAIERQMAMPSAELEKVTDELQRFAAAMRSPQQPQGLIELVDALNQRISDIELNGPGAASLRADVDAMRSAVADAIEPRFAALEQQLETISERVAQGPEINISQLEAQVRQLVARMDQTGEQLTGLAKLYNQPVEREPGPDLDALADMVAERTSAAVKAGQKPAGMGEPEYAEIERRVGRIMQSIAAERAAEDSSPLEATIREVNDRLARLEQSVTKPAPLPPVAVAPTTVAPAPEPVTPAELHRDPIVPLLDELSREAPPPVMKPVIDLTPEPEPELAKPVVVPPVRDAMPANPGDEAPLYDKPFGDPNPVQRALEAKNGPRRRHPGMGVAIEPTDELPPAPIPSIDFSEPELPAFDPAPPEPVLPPRGKRNEKPVAVEPAVEAEADGELSTNRNTFIAAARRAAMRQPALPVPAAVASMPGGSLIARAFARFQAARGDARIDAPDVTAEAPIQPVPPPPEPAMKAEKPARASKFKLGRRQLAGDKEPVSGWQPDETASVAPPAPEPHHVALGAEETSPVEDDEHAAKPGLITRHRTLILAITTFLVAIALANLVIQRTQEATPAAAPAEKTAATPPATVGDATLSPTPLAQQLVLPTTPAGGAKPRVIGAVDPIQTASVDPAAAHGFAPLDTQSMPPAVAAATDLAVTDGDSDVETVLPKVANLSDTVQPLATTPATPATLESPVKVELPPENVGPMPLRQAAANGDARAQFEIAAIYTEGRAVPEDLKAAAVWYERAATQGFAPAQYRLGSLYESGKGVDKDLAQARLWYQQAAEAGNRMAMHNLAALYAGGGLGNQQFDAAAKWFEEAADRGMKDSQFNLGMLYARGLGVKQDLAASYKWFGLAASRGDADAGKARDDIAKSLDAATVQRLNAELAAWSPSPINLVANFAPIGTWAKDFDPGAPISKVEVVKGVQQALARLGFDAGTPDGVAGRKTADAIKAFERGTGMNETGTINPRLLAVLGSQPV